ncbi:MAG: hypothetical protein ACMUJM_06760 [bacterium]
MTQKISLFLVELLLLFSLYPVPYAKGIFPTNNHKEKVVITNNGVHLLCRKELIEHTPEDEFFTYYRNDKDTLDYSKIWKLNNYLNSWKK